MRHNGVAFPPLHQPVVREVRIKNQIVTLAPLQEEMLMEWAKKLTTPYVEDPVFRKNFLDSLREVSAENHFPVDFGAVELDDIDWSELQAVAEQNKLSNMPEERRKQVSAERKKVREALKEKYGQAEVDGHSVEIAAYLVEPPGIFMGRGAHPLRGRWKPRIYPEDVELNLDEDAPVPAPMYEGHEWKGIVHEHDGLWVARWTDRLANKIKYVWLAETSHLRQAREKEKYDKASRLRQALAKVRRETLRGMRSRDERTRRLATVAYLIDHLAMRVGDEKDEDEADTVGASTLRVEHVKFHPDRIEFDFLGKDSVRWEKDLPIDDETRQLEANLREFTEGKPPDAQIFHDISSANVNAFFKKIMPGLSAKVFRTFHATTTVEEYLSEQNPPRDAADAEKDYVARMANLQAAIQCNHKRTPPKNWEENLNKREEALRKLRHSKPDLAKLDAQVEARRRALEELKVQQERFQAEAPKAVAKKEAALKALEAQPAPESDAGKAKWEKRKKAAVKAIIEAQKANKAKVRRYKERLKKAEQSLKTARNARERAEETYHERLLKAERQLELARQTRDYNLNTSLKNYIDPRVYREWGQRIGYDWTRLYTTALQRKFKWVKEEDEFEDVAEEEEEMDETPEQSEAPQASPDGNGGGPGANREEPARAPVGGS